MNWYLEVWKKYATFSGRARRKEYWMFQLLNIIVVVILLVIEKVAGLSGSYGFGVLSWLYSLAIIIPNLAVAVRRLHDTNHSGWYLLIGLIPLVGAILLLVYFVQDSDVGQNQYGPNPKEVAA